MLIVLLIFGPVLSSQIDPSLTDWKLITENLITVNVPMKKYILEIKSTLPEDFDTNPVYNETIKVDKSTTMMLVLYDGENQVGRLTWNSIQYKRGYDAWIEQCNIFYVPFRSFPCGGRKDQVWAWKLNKNDVELSCDGELQYYQHYLNGDNWKHLRERCRKLGQADVDRVEVKFMKNFYIRAVPRDDKPEPTQAKVTTPPTTPTQRLTTSAPLPGRLAFAKDFPTCDCWTPECGFCSNMECTVKCDLFSSFEGIVVRSKLTRGKPNSIALFGDEGDLLGNFQWDLSGIFLTGCIRCRPSVALRRAKAVIGLTPWAFSMKDGVVEIKILGRTLFRRTLKGKCAKAYRKAKRFAFYGMSCENRFRLLPDMVPGVMLTPSCDNTCSLY